MKRIIYKDINKLPVGTATAKLTRGCLVLEGGGWKGLYTLGVLDSIMEHGIELTSVVGVSAGALSAVGYVSGQIGWGARIDLAYRHDSNYCGFGALKRSHGITGFDYLYDNIFRAHPLDKRRLEASPQRLAVSASNMLTGEVEYFEKDSCDILKAVQASASVPYVTMPVIINGIPYLDGGCVEKIPYRWADTSGESKVVVVRTRELSYRRKPGTSPLTNIMYRKYPKFAEALSKVNENFNSDVEELQRRAKNGDIFLISPSETVQVTRFDGDMDKLGALYWLGYNDMNALAPALKEYLGI